LWQLKQRIAIRMSLSRMDRETVGHYLIFRWSKAGAIGPIPFSGGAIDAIAAWSKGIPRMINAICDNALLIAFSDEMRTVEVRHIREACKELDLPVSPLRPRFDSTTFEAAPQSIPVEPVESEPDLPPANNHEPQLWIEERPSLLKRWIGMGPKEKE
jgi:general secretion pathway protein A